PLCHSRPPPLFPLFPYTTLFRSVIVAASCVETARILLNSKSRHYPAGIANSSGQVGRNLCDHLYGTTGSGYLPHLLGQPSFPDRSEEHTSELQSPYDLVCRLLLE